MLVCFVPFLVVSVPHLFHVYLFLVAAFFVCLFTHRNAILVRNKNKLFLHATVYRNL